MLWVADGVAVHDAEGDRLMVAVAVAVPKGLREIEEDGVPVGDTEAVAEAVALIVADGDATEGLREQGDDCEIVCKSLSVCVGWGSRCRG